MITTGSLATVLGRDVDQNTDVGGLGEVRADVRSVGR